MASPTTSLALAYIRSELPAWGKLLPKVDRELRAEEFRIIECKPHGYRVRLNMADTFERTAFILNRYSDLGVQLAVQDVLRPGDAAVDIGANIGFLSLLMAKCVGPTGFVRAYEPNPPVHARLANHVQENKLTHVDVRQCALADAPGVLKLKVLRGNLGLATLREIEAGEQQQVLSEHEVQVRVGDSELADLVRASQEGTRPLRLIKIDVEGFECKVLAGLLQTLRIARPMVVTEAVDVHLRAAGASLQQLVQMMRDAGYKGYHMHLRRTGLTSAASLRIPVEQAAPKGCYNILWEHGGL